MSSANLATFEKYESEARSYCREFRVVCGMRGLEVLDGIDAAEFIASYPQQHEPVVVKDLAFDGRHWTPEYFTDTIKDSPIVDRSYQWGSDWPTASNVSSRRETS